jgi:hypothetical protein
MTADGWERLVPVGKRGTILKNRAEVSAPYKFRDVIVTNEKVKE